MVIGRAASGGALAPEPAARHRSRTRISPVLFWVLPLFFEIGRLPLHFFEMEHDFFSRFFEIGLHVPPLRSDQAPFPAFLRSDDSSI